MYVKVIITPILIKNIKIYECFEKNLEKINGIIIKKLYQKLEIINKASNSTDFYKSIFKDQHDDLFKSDSKNWINCFMKINLIQKIVWSLDLHLVVKNIRKIIF